MAQPITIIKLRESFPAGPVQTVNGRSGEVVLAKADVGLGNVNNTADSVKPVSAAQQAALDAKRDITDYYDMGSGTEMLSGKCNVKTVDADVTLTMSGTPPNGTVTRLILVITTACVVTFPSSFRIGGEHTEKIVSLDVPVGVQEFSFEKIRGDFYLVDSCGDVKEAVGTPPAVVETPTFNPSAAGSPFNADVNVEFLCGTAGVTFYYTTDGSTPTEASILYTGPVTLTTTTTLKVIAVKSGMTNSAVATGGFTIDKTAPTISSWTIGTNGTTHTLVFSENVTAGGDGWSGLVANLTGGAVNLTYVSGTGTNTIVFTGSRTVLTSETETGNKGQFTQPGAGIRDIAGNLLATVTGKTITNGSTQTGAGGGDYYYSFVEGTGNTEGSSGQLGKNFSPDGTKIASVPAGTITEVGFKATTINAGSTVHIGLLNASKVPVTLLGNAFAGSSGWKDITGLSQAHAGGDIFLQPILDPSSPYDGAVECEWKNGGGSFGGDAKSGSWPVGFTFSAGTVILLMRVKVV